MEAELETMNKYDEKYRKMIKLHELITNRFEKNLNNLIPSLENFKNEVKKKFPQLTSTKSKKNKTSKKIVKHFEKREAKKSRNEHNKKFKKSIINENPKPSGEEEAAKKALYERNLANEMIVSYESLNP